MVWGKTGECRAGAAPALPSCTPEPEIPQPGPAAPGLLHSLAPTTSRAAPAPKRVLAVQTVSRECCQPCRPAVAPLASLAWSGFPLRTSLVPVAFCRLCPSPLTAASRRARSPHGGETCALRGTASRLGASQLFSKSHAALLAGRCAFSRTFAPSTSGVLRCADLPCSAPTRSCWGQAPGRLQGCVFQRARRCANCRNPVMPSGVVPSLGTRVVSVVKTNWAHSSCERCDQHLGLCVAIRPQSVVAEFLQYYEPKL